MATYTSNLNLKKPATSDKIRIADFNNNADLIDAGYGDQDTSMGKLGGGMAIISTGNVHAAIAAGQFVYVRKHGTLAEGLYTADSAISANGTLSTSNLTAVSGGGLNALAGRFADNVKLVVKTGSNTYNINIPSSSQHFLIMATNNIEICYVAFVLATSTGSVSTKDIVTGTGVTITTSTTNTLTFAFTGSNRQLNIQDIVFAGDAVS